jgi:hypothetical protein
MYETITVDAAITKGKRMVTYPTIVILVVAPLLLTALGVQMRYLTWVSAWVLSWLYWSVMITKWRLWAFDKVRNVHELKQKAIQENLIWSDNHFIGKTEIRTSGDRAKWQSLQEKFNQPDIFIEDFTVPNETNIYFAKRKNIFEWGISLLLVGSGACMMLTGYWIGVGVGTVLVVIGIFLFYYKWNRPANIDKEPQLVLSEKGIQTPDNQFFEWKNINNENVLSSRERTYLTFSHANGKEKIPMDDYDTNQSALTTLLILYRGRNEQLKRG